MLHLKASPTVLRMRGAIVLGGEHATYAGLMINYWKVTPFFGLLQVLGLVVAWVHGCLGLYGWLRLRRWWPVVSPFLYPVAFALPILALLGFVDAGKQALARFAGSDNWPLQVRIALARFAVLAPQLQVWRDHFLLGYATAAFAACLVFATQAIRHRRRTARVIHVGGHQIEREAQIEPDRMLDDHRYLWRAVDGLGTDGSQTPRWRGLDSNFQYAGAVNLIVAPFADRLFRVGPKDALHRDDCVAGPGRHDLRGNRLR